MMNGDLGTAAGRSDLVRLVLQLIVEEALEGEVSDVLGRERYERGEGEKASYRNEYRRRKVKTAEGAVDYSAPQVLDTPEPFVSDITGCPPSAPMRQSEFSRRESARSRPARWRDSPSPSP